MMVLANMNFQARIGRYKQRGFQTFEAEVIVLIEESAAALFNSFPNRFILFGGAALVLFYESPRLSRDLDLLASPEDLPKAEEIQAAVLSSIQPIAEVFGLGQLDFRKDAASPDFVKHWVLANQKPLFSIDLTRMGGNVLGRQIVRKSISDAPEKTVFTPNENYLLFQKCETFLNRRYVKARDAFDIHFLLSMGAKLDQGLEAHLEDFRRMREIDQMSVESRVESITAKLCTAELRSVLPLDVFEQLGKYEFESIRRSLRLVFSKLGSGGSV
jgi:hypothetical protein